MSIPRRPAGGKGAILPPGRDAPVAQRLRHMHPLGAGATLLDQGQVYLTAIGLRHADNQRPIDLSRGVMLESTAELSSRLA